MTIDLHALAEALRYTNNALDQVGQPDYSLTNLVRDIRQNMKQAATALAKLQTQHEAEQAEARLAKYDELIYAVGTKYPNESRHETALRYIREREQSSVQSNPAGVARRKEST